MQMRIVATLIGLSVAAGAAGRSAAALPAEGNGGPCLQAHDIDHTDAPDDRTILFYLKDHSVWRNSLPATCPTLHSESAFIFATNFPEICSNAQTIRVLRSGVSCKLGAFTREPAPPGSAQPQ